jgi:hypothetical protein
LVFAARGSRGVNHEIRAALGHHELMSSARRFSTAGFQLVPYMDAPTRGMLFTDSVGPWWDELGEIVPVVSEAFDRVADEVTGTWRVYSNITELDGWAFDIGFPELTLLVQAEWDRVFSEVAPPQRQFLPQQLGFEATVGSVVEQLVLASWFEEAGRFFFGEDAELCETDAVVATGCLNHPKQGLRTDDATVMIADRPLALIECKASIGRWSMLRRTVRKAMAQLRATEQANLAVDPLLLVFACSLSQRWIGIFELPVDETDDHNVWKEFYSHVLTADPTNKPPTLSPGHHPNNSAYTNVVGENTVHAFPSTSSSMYAGIPPLLSHPLYEKLLAGSNVSDSIKWLIPFALDTIGQHQPDANGLVAPARYAGPGATGALGNLAHSTRSDAFAAELITAASFIARPWPDRQSPNRLGNLRWDGGRIDFGVKLGVGLAKRKTIEADLLLTDAKGRRHAIDVKFTTNPTFRSVPSAAMLDLARATIDSGELSSFTFVTNKRFVPSFLTKIQGRGLGVIEGVWPTEDDLDRIARVINQSIDWSALGQLGGTEERIEQLIDECAHWYDSTFPNAEVVRIDSLQGGHSLLFDHRASDDLTASRLVAVWGQTGPAPRKRDRSYMAGLRQPKSPVGQPFDRGHLTALSAGGHEGMNVNLVPQDRPTNQGHGPHGKRWRAQENRAKLNPGSWIFVRCIYDDSSEIPARIDSYLEAPTFRTLERFVNRWDTP